jgi:hypothetical protein
MPGAADFLAEKPDADPGAWCGLSGTLRLKQAGRTR